MLKRKRRSLRRPLTAIELQDRAMKRAQAEIVRLERDLVGLHQLREAQEAAAKATADDILATESSVLVATDQEPCCERTL